MNENAAWYKSYAVFSKIGGKALKKTLFSIIFAMTVIFGAAAHASELTVLSGNTFFPGDYKAYSDNGENLTILNTGASYSWTSDSDKDIIKNDVKSRTDGKGNITGYVRVMTDGNILNHSGSYVAHSSWESGTPSSAVFDLKDVYTVSRVDVWSSSTSYQQMGELRVAVSDDGENFTEVGSWQAHVPDKEIIEQAEYKQGNSHTICSFREVNARYIKVTGKKASVTAYGKHCSQYVFGEIVIMGGEKKEMDPSAERIYFENSDGERVYSFNSGGTYVTKINVRDTDAVLVSAQYDSDGRLKKAALSDGQYRNIGEKYTLKNEIEISEFESGDSLRAYIFDSADGMHPIAKKAELKDIDTSKSGLLSSDTPRSSSTIVYPVSDGYSWVTSGKYASDSAFVGKENMLFDGNIKDIAEAESNNDAYADICIHLTDTMKIERFVIYAMCSGDSYMSEYDIYASMDGVNYEYVTTKKNTLSAAVKRVMPVSVDVDGVLHARDIKLVLKKASGIGKMGIAEIEVYGRPPERTKQRLSDYAYETEMPFKTSDDIIAADSAGVLSDGDLETAVTSTGDYVSVIYSADEFYQPEDITVIGYHSGCEFLTSLDGVSYFSQGFFPCVDGRTEMMGKADTNAKHIKLVFRKGERENISLSEIVLNVRGLYDINSAASAKIPVKATLKANNILYLDWSDYNQSKNNVSSYSVYIGEKAAQSGLSKTIYINGGNVPVREVTEQYCTYVGLAPDTDYEVTVVPYGKTVSDGTPVKIHTNDALGGNKLSGIFCINEYIYGGGAHVAHTMENSGMTETMNLDKKIKLITDMEVFSKTRYWENSEDIFKKYMSRGLGFHQYARTESSVKLCNDYGIYSYCSANEPDINSAYQNNPEKYVEVSKTNHNLIKNIDSKNVLAEASICGTDKLSFVESLYNSDSNYGSYYDVVDVHAYCKAFEGKQNHEDNLSDNAEAYSIPEHLFTKKARIDALLASHNDSAKNIIFTEIGWSTHTLPYSQDVVAEGVTKEQQANFVARAYLISAALGIKNVFLYAFQDESYETTNREYQFGIVDWYGNPKPAYYSYYTLGKLLKNAEFVERVNTITHPNYGVVFYDTEKSMYLTALWNVSGNGTSVRINSDDSQYLVTDVYGNTKYVSGNEIEIGSAPIYIYSSDKLTVAGI